MREKNFKKPNMKLISNVGMVPGNQIAHNYAGHLKDENHFKQNFLKARNAEGVKWFDILNMYSKQDLIDWYTENIIKTKTIYHNKIWRKASKKNILRIYQNILMKQQKKIL